MTHSYATRLSTKGKELKKVYEDRKRLFDFIRHNEINQDDTIEERLESCHLLYHKKTEYTQCYHGKILYQSLFEKLHYYRRNYNRLYNQLFTIHQGDESSIISDIRLNKFYKEIDQAEKKLFNCTTQFSKIR